MKQVTTNVDYLWEVIIYSSKATLIFLDLFLIVVFQSNPLSKIVTSLAPKDWGSSSVGIKDKEGKEKKRKEKKRKEKKKRKKKKKKKKRKEKKKEKNKEEKKAKEKRKEKKRKRTKEILAKTKFTNKGQNNRLQGYCWTKISIRV